MTKHIPHKTVKKRKGLPINQSIRRLIRKRDRLYKLCKVSYSEAKYKEFKSLKHEVQHEMRVAYWSNTNNLITPDTHNHFDQKIFWSYIKALRKENTGVLVLDDISYETSLYRQS